MKTPAPSGTSRFRGPTAARLLGRLGIEPKRYWVLVDLYKALSKRQERIQLGHHDFSMGFLLILLFAFSSVASLLWVATGDYSHQFYLPFFIALTIFPLAIVMLPEAAENLVNPVEAAVFAHMPVNGATWAGAKLTHLTRLVLYVVAGVNIVPAMVGLFLPHRPGFPAAAYPPLHFVSTLGSGVFAALACCALLGWLVRFVPARRLKGAALLFAALPMGLAIFLNMASRWWDDLSAWMASIEPPEAWLSTLDAVPGGWPAAAGAAGLAVAIPAVGFGLRALSRDHLIRVYVLTRKGPALRRRKPRRRRTGAWVSGLAGGPAARAGYEYTRTMLMRDWQFRRYMASESLFVVIGFIAVLVAGRGSSPFSGDFAPTHFLPHVLGLGIFQTCQFLVYGNDHKGVWQFFLAPGSSLGPFAHGVHAALWLLLVVVPNALIFLVLAWSWNLWEAVVFTAYSTAAASLYLAIWLGRVNGLPFGRQPEPQRKVAAVGIVFLFLFAIAIAVGIQYVLFMSVAAVIAVTLIVALGAYALTRSALRGLESRIVLHLQTAAAGSIMLYTEVE